MKKIILLLIIFSSTAIAEDLTTCNPISKYSLKDENIGSMTLRCPSGKFMGAVACSSELYKETHEVTLLSSNSARCDFELQTENEEWDYDNDYNLIAPPIVLDRARLQINCCTR